MLECVFAVRVISSSTSPSLSPLCLFVILVRVADKDKELVACCLQLLLILCATHWRYFGDSIDF